MTRPVIPAPSTRVVEQHSGVVLSGEGLRVANDRLSMVDALVRIDMLAGDNERLRRKLENVKAELANTLPVAWAASKAATLANRVAQEYKKQADEFEQACDELNERNFELVEENSSLRMRLEELGPHL